MLETLGLILIGLIIVVVLWFGSSYNTLVTLRNRFKNGFAQIDVQLKRRYDLIPNLVETAKGYLAHERQTLEAVIAARNQAATASNVAASAIGDPTAMRGLASAEGILTGVMTKFMALTESYPELKGNENMARLLEELSSTENRVGFARQAYNDAVMEYNTNREQFPAVLLAGAFGFGPAEHLTATSTETERSAPAVKF